MYIDRKALLYQNKEKLVDSNVVPLVLNFHLALSEVNDKVNSLHASDEMKEVFKDKRPLISFRRPRNNLSDNLVRSKIKRDADTGKVKGMKKCGKSRYQICCYVEEQKNLNMEIISIG